MFSIENIVAQHSWAFRAFDPEHSLRKRCKFPVRWPPPLFHDSPKVKVKPNGCAAKTRNLYFRAPSRAPSVVAVERFVDWVTAQHERFRRQCPEPLPQTETGRGSEPASQVFNPLPDERSKTMRTYHKNIERQTASVPSWTTILAQAVNTPGMMLEAYSAFHQYSIGNQLLALVQCQQRYVELEVNVMERRY